MHISKATLADLQEASGNLSKGDLEEFHCNIPNRDPKDVLPWALDETTMAIKVGALVLAVGGHKGGDIWFVTTTVVDRLSKVQRMGFYRILKEHLWSLPGNYTNKVSINNKTHIRLLESLGATFAERTVMSPAGFAFRQFWL